MNLAITQTSCLVLLSGVQDREGELNQTRQGGWVELQEGDGSLKGHQEQFVGGRAREEDPGKVNMNRMSTEDML